MTTVDDQAGSAALERAAPVIAEEVVATARLALAYCRAGGGDTSRAELRRAFVAARAMAAEPRCRRRWSTPASAARSTPCDEAVGTAHVVGAPPLMGEVVVGAGVLRRCAGSGGGGGGGEGRGGEAMRWSRRKLQQEGAAAAVRDAAMRLSAANSTAYNPGTGAAVDWLTATADGAITLAAQLALDALEEARRRRVGRRRARQQRKKNSPQGVATDMQLIDAAPRATPSSPTLAPAASTSPSLSTLPVPAMYSSVVADADGPPLNGAKEKEGRRRPTCGRAAPTSRWQCAAATSSSPRGRRRAQVGANGQAARRRGVVRDACRPRPSRRRRRARPRRRRRRRRRWRPRRRRRLVAALRGRRRRRRRRRPPHAAGTGRRAHNPFEKKKDDKNAREADGARAAAPLVRRGRRAAAAPRAREGGAGGAADAPGTYGVAAWPRQPRRAGARSAAPSPRRRAGASRSTPTRTPPPTATARRRRRATGARLNARRWRRRAKPAR